MNAAKIVDNLRSAGYVLLLNAGKVRVEGPELTPEAREQILANREAIVLELVRRDALVVTYSVGGVVQPLPATAPPRRLGPKALWAEPAVPRPAGSQKLTSTERPAPPLRQARLRPFAGWQPIGDLTPTEHLAAIGGYPALAAVDLGVAHRLWDAERLWQRDGPERGARWQRDYQRIWEDVT